MRGSKRCEVIVRFANYRVGEFIYPPAMHRDQLVRDGWVRIVDSVLPEPRVIETATAATPENTAMPAPVKRGRGRPRKDSYAHPTN